MTSKPPPPQTQTLVDPHGTSDLNIALITLRRKNTELMQLERAQTSQLDRMEMRLAVPEDQGHDNHYGVYLIIRNLISILCYTKRIFECLVSQRHCPPLTDDAQRLLAETPTHIVSFKDPVVPFSSTVDFPTLHPPPPVDDLEAATILSTGVRAGKPSGPSTSESNILYINSPPPPLLQHRE